MEKLFTHAVFVLSFVLANFGNRSYNSTESDFFRLQVTFQGSFMGEYKSLVPRVIHADM